MLMPKNCPRCGSDELSHGWSAPPMSGSVQCHADGCECHTVAETEQEAIRLWNAGVWHSRVIERDESGNPSEFERNPDLARPTTGDSHDHT